MACLLVSSLLFSIAATISPAQALSLNWTPPEKYGDFGSITGNGTDTLQFYKTKNQRFGMFNSSLDNLVQNMTCMNWNVTISSFGAMLAQGSFNDYQDLVIVMRLVSTDIFFEYETINLNLTFHDETNGWTSNNHNPSVTLADGRTNPFADINPPSASHPYQWQVYAINNGSGVVDWHFRCLIDDLGTVLANGTSLPYLIYDINFTSYVSQEFFSLSRVVIPEVTVIHSGVGYINATITGKVYNNGELPEFVPSLSRDKVLKTVTKGFEFFGQILQALQMIYELFITVLSAVGGFISAIIPYTPLLLAIYILDAFIASILTGSFQPIGFLMRTGWTFIVTAFTAIVAFGTLVWDAITFWN